MQTAPLNFKEAKRLRAKIGESTVAILECCDEVLRIDEANRSPDGSRSSELLTFIHTMLRWSVSKFSNLATIAKDERIQAQRATDPASLPTSWGALYQLTQLDDDGFKYGFTSRRKYDHNLKKWIAQPGPSKPVIHQDATVSSLKAYRGSYEKAPEPKTDKRATVKVAAIELYKDEIDHAKIDACLEKLRQALGDTAVIRSYEPQAKEAASKENEAHRRRVNRIPPGMRRTKNGTLKARKPPNHKANFMKRTDKLLMALYREREGICEGIDLDARPREAIEEQISKVKKLLSDIEAGKAFDFMHAATIDETL